MRLADDRDADCGEYLGTWDELQTDFEKQGGNNGVFRLEKGRIRRIDSRIGSGAGRL